jgi:hypothetical protein
MRYTRRNCKLRYIGGRECILTNTRRSYVFSHISQACGIIFAVCVATTALAQTLPFYPIPTETVSGNLENSPGLSRLKISLTTSKEAEIRELLVGNITACSESVCYRPVSPAKKIGVDTTKEGKAATVMEFAIPRIKIVSLHFESLAGSNALIGSVKVQNPMEFDKEYFGEDILVVLAKNGTGRNGEYIPQFATAGPFHPSIQSVYYNPTIATVARLPMSTLLSIPANATATPVIFNVAVHDTLDKFPMVDIQPTILFNKPAILTSREIFRSTNSATSSATGQAIRPDSSSKNLPRTGLIRLMSRDVDPSEMPVTASSESNITASSVTAADACLGFLGSSQQAIDSALSTTGTVFLRGCETTPSAIHIAISNTVGGKVIGSISYTNSAVNPQRFSLALRTLPTLAVNSQIGINGFTWSGDSGIGSGTGYALGFVQDRGIFLANNIIGGGTAFQDASNTDNNKLALNQAFGQVARWAEGRSGTLFPNDNFISTLFLVSSSTSIVKAGVCASDTTANRWSAIGSSPNGRLVFISSTSEGITSAAGLCAIFTSLGVNNAIRLDGSTASGMTIDGVLVNPITGSASFVYGSARHIAYAVQMKYASFSYGPTPVINTPQIVPTPRNPCRVNPRACS